MAESQLSETSPLGNSWSYTPAVNVQCAYLAIRHTLPIQPHSGNSKSSSLSAYKFRRLGMAAREKATMCGPSDQESSSEAWVRHGPYVSCPRFLPFNLYL
jgi:hypothetical protein